MKFTPLTLTLSHPSQGDGGRGDERERPRFALTPTLSRKRARGSEGRPLVFGFEVIFPGQAEVFPVTMCYIREDEGDGGSRFLKDVPILPTRLVPFYDGASLVFVGYLTSGIIFLMTY